MRPVTAEQWATLAPTMPGHARCASCQRPKPLADLGGKATCAKCRTRITGTVTNAKRLRSGLKALYVESASRTESRTK